MIARAPLRKSGFTLIEVVAALLTFSMGVIMMLRLTTALSRSMEHSAINSLITVEGQERMDSLSALAYGSLSTGTVQDTITVRGVRFRRSHTVTQCPCSGASGSPLVKKISVLVRQVSGTGPTYTSTSYVGTDW